MIVSSPRVKTLFCQVCIIMIQNSCHTVYYTISIYQRNYMIFNCKKRKIFKIAYKKSLEILRVKTFLLIAQLLRSYCIVSPQKMTILNLYLNDKIIELKRKHLWQLTFTVV